MAPRACPNKDCKGTTFVQDPSSGEYCCKECGTVAEESRIVSEVTFGESSSGAAIVTGSFVAADQAHAASGGLHGHQGESRAQTLEKTRRRINAIAAKLQIREDVSGMAFQYFKLALARNFVKGRKSHYVVSACLYLACRLNKTYHMLMDFAEAICVNVFGIGGTYLQMVKALDIINIPVKDPVVFIQRFASKLNLKEDSKQVMNDASKLVHRMGKDWLTEGRRPAGIAAACVLLAARMNNIRVSKAQIVQIAKVGEDTVQRRLDEFSNTSAGGLSVGVFRATKIESEADPPAFLRHREMEKKMAERIVREKAALDRGDGLDPELIDMAREIDQNLEEVGEALEYDLAPNKNGTNDSSSTNNATRTNSDNDTDDNDDNNNTPQSSNRNRISSSNGSNNENDALPIEPSSEGSHANDKYAADSSASASVATGGGGRRVPSRAELFLKRYEAQKAAAIAAALASGNEDIDLSGLRGGIIGNVRNRHGATWVSEVPDDPERLSDVDDDEIDASILNDTEIEIKSQVWMSMNREYLIEQENKRLKMEADKAAGIYKPPKKRKRNNNSNRSKDSTYKIGPDGTLPSASANAQQVLQARAFSKKLNYQVVDVLFAKKAKKIDENQASGSGS